MEKYFRSPQLIKKNKMGTRLDIKELREYLIDLYERIVGGEDVKVEARKVFEDYGGSDKFIRKICRLLSIF